MDPCMNIKPGKGFIAALIHTYAHSFAEKDGNQSHFPHHMPLIWYPAVFLYIHISMHYDVEMKK